MIRFFELNNEGIIAGRDFLSMMVNKKKSLSQIPKTSMNHWAVEPPRHRDF